MAECFNERFMLIAAQPHGTADGVVPSDYEDGFFHDALRLPDGQRVPLARGRSSGCSASTRPL